MCDVTKNTCYAEVTEPPTTCCVDLQKSRVRKSSFRLSSIVQCFVCQFNFVRLPNSFEANPWIESTSTLTGSASQWPVNASIEIQFDCVRLTMPASLDREGAFEAVTL